MYQPSSGRRTRPSSNFGGNNKRRYGGGGGGNRGRGGGGQRRGQYIDPKRFVKAAKHVEKVIYEPVNNFEDFAVEGLIKRNLAQRGFINPTQIQDKAIPVALEGHDVVGIANTGTGKTAAFLIPLLNSLIQDKDQSALVIAPTRELAVQIQEEARALAKGARIFDVLLIGGTPMYRQLRDLQRRPQLIIGTPGRMKDHIDRGTLHLRNVSTVVLDEVDRMLDMGFINDIRSILEGVPKDRQSLFFSATMSTNIEHLIRTFTNSPKTIMARTAETSDNVEQSVIHVKSGIEKMDKLHDLLTVEIVQKTLIFCETKRNTEKLSKDLATRGFRTDAMHGNKSQGQRQRALRKFKAGEVTILVATDVAARGIDVDGITHVVNYDVPHSYDDYTHRIGRTGRGDNTGNAVTFVVGSSR